MEAACVLSEIAQLYAAYPHCVAVGYDLIVTDTAPKGDYDPNLLTMSDANIGERPFFYQLG